MEAIVLLSGGIDSATSLYLAKRKGYLVRALTVRIRHMAGRELRSANRLADAAGVEEHRFFSLPELRELGDFDAPARLAALPRTYIPMKNAIYYSVAAAFAEEVGAGRLVGGHNKDDVSVFEDTSEQFFDNLEKALRAASSRLRKQDLRIWRPLRKMSKAQVVTLATKLGVPLEMSWSCHKDGRAHCWKCEGCIQRKRAFSEAGVPDPLRA